MKSYTKVYSLGDSRIPNIFVGDYIVEEKIDGSCINFGRDLNGKLWIRSRRQDIDFSDLEKVNNLFKDAVKYIVSIKDRLRTGWTYRGECLWRNKHNVLNYGRIPKNNVMIFDIENELGKPIVLWEEKKKYANEIDFEVVPLIGKNCIDKTNLVESIKSLLEKESILGNEKIEGIVVKNYSQPNRTEFGYSVGKFVADRFKERHHSNIKKGNSQNLPIWKEIAESLKTDARFMKAIQHLEESGKRTKSPSDIGDLFKLVHKDIEEEESEYIKNKLYKFYIKNIKKSVCQDLPNFYKEYLIQEEVDIIK